MAPPEGLICFSSNCKQCALLPQSTGPFGAFVHWNTLFMYRIRQGPVNVPGIPQKRHYHCYLRMRKQIHTVSIVLAFKLKLRWLERAHWYVVAGTFLGLFAVLDLRTVGAWTARAVTEPSLLTSQSNGRKQKSRSVCKTRRESGAQQSKWMTSMCPSFLF